MKQLIIFIELHLEVCLIVINFYLFVKYLDYVASSKIIKLIKEKVTCLTGPADGQTTDLNQETSLLQFTFIH